MSSPNEPRIPAPLGRGVVKTLGKCPEDKLLAHLIVKHPGGTETYELCQQLYKIGRDPSCEIRINHRTVSRVHCCLVRSYELEPNAYLLVHGPLIERKEARNGVYVGSEETPILPKINIEDYNEVGVGQAYILSYGQNIRLSPVIMLLYREPVTSKPKKVRDDSTLSQ